MHAYLITAYDSFNILKKELRLLDDPRNDIFIHIDANTKGVDLKDIEKACKYSRVYFTKRIPVRWGTSDIMKSEYLLWETASENKNYDYYHFISGRDLPLWTQDEIHEFFEKHQGINFLPIRNYAPMSKEFASRYEHFVFWPHYMIKKQTVWTKIAVKISGELEKLQSWIGVNRFKNVDFKVCRGMDYCSITDDFCRYIVQQKTWSMRWFGKLTMFPDEFYLSTLAYNSKFRETLYKPQDGEDDALREIRWEQGRMRPHIWTMDDLDFLKNSKNIFARKFDEGNMDVVDAVFQHVRNKGKSI